MQGKRLSLYSEPYYPPGYCGYTPQFHFQFGDTYGKTTARLLKDQNVSKSGISVLANVMPRDDNEDQGRANKRNCVRLKRLSWGDHKLTDNMVPGYTGFIPLGENHFGSRYAQLCQDAISKFHHNQHAAKQKRTNGLLIERKPPLLQSNSDAAPYVSTHQIQHSISPYLMSENDPEKTFMSGYTGFIPRSRSRFAMGYPQLTMQALREFTKDQQSMKLNATLAVDLSETRLPAMKATNSRAKSHSIYVKSGLMPQYTGYLPGHKFQFGDTYGTNARYFHATNCSR